MPQEAVGLRRGLEPSSSFSFPHFVLHWNNSSQLAVILPQVAFLVVTNRNIYIWHKMSIVLKVKNGTSVRYQGKDETCEAKQREKEESCNIKKIETFKPAHVPEVT